MRVLKSPEFAKRAGRFSLDDAALLKAAEEIESGRIDARLGKHLIKQRIARTGGGKSGSYRSVAVHVIGDRALFIYAFPKNEKANLGAHELDLYRDAAKVLSDLPIEQLLKANWIEITHGGHP
ncbi:type II toxin-antitoxin system RelE/ParE family toxin [Pleomorphomonas koreensis]|uniref:type II toxin-antitoxin system RelE/ParE family toxin n=1 Tax=Pleomorphomonas koreensis TaxID=257440 RepID=UPI000423C507|nr:type II toxin-antitoxin system RelE/ParE family toxin [Pleomorphomonas koreensis]